MANLKTSENVKINVGGTLFETCRSTLDKLESDYFNRLLDPKSGFRQPDDGIQFVDRDPQCFRVILNMARYDEIHLTNSASIEMVERDAEFYLIAEKYRRLITDFKMACTHQILHKMPSTGGNVHLNLTLNEYLSEKGKLFHHHQSLHMQPVRHIQGVSLTCPVKSCQMDGTMSLTVVLSNPITCLRCGREIQMDGPECYIHEWCHKCRRCVRCTDSLCIPVLVRH